MSISFEPDFELTFDENNRASLLISNEKICAVVCRIQATMENCYKINPTYFFVSSHQKTVATIEFNGDEYGDDCLDHEFNVQWWPTHEEHLPENAENYWKQNLKNHRRNITTKNFGVEFKNQPLQNTYTTETIINNTQTVQKTSLNKDMESFAIYAINSHKTVVELNSEFESLIEEMEAAEDKEMNETIKNLREISVIYKHLEHRTRAAVDKTATVISNVAKVANDKDLKPFEKLEAIKNRYRSLDEQFDSLSEEHIRISRQLDREANKAEAAKERNDQRVEKAKNMKKAAKALGALGTPVCGFAASVAACAVGAFNSVEGDNSGLKVLAGAGGALGGVVVGTVVTAGSPILLTIAAVLAVKSKKWSAKFKSMHETIRRLQEIMDQAASYLTRINAYLDMLMKKIEDVKLENSAGSLNAEFKYIKDICAKITEKCHQYDKLAQAKAKGLRQVNRPGLR